jgi:spore maturation protein CgeB
MGIDLFNKTMLLCPPKYSLKSVFENILINISSEVIYFDVLNYVSDFETKLNTQIFRFPNKIKSKWTTHYQQKINSRLLLDFQLQNPELVFVYNSEMLLPSTISKMKKTAKVIFFLGDSPFYTFTNNYFLTVLNMADLVLTPDSFWLQQLLTVGISNSFLFYPGMDDSSYNKNPEQELLKTVKETDIIYCGMSYPNSWGYKKAMLLSKFTSLNFTFYGDRNWQRWFPFFPELRNSFQESGYIATPLLNAMFNKAKLMPVDGNPGVLNGVHLRLFEALSAGVLPLIEYRKDVDEILFKGIKTELPLIKSYKSALSVAERYLSNDTLRSECIHEMKSHLAENYSHSKNAERIVELIAVAKR